MNILSWIPHTKELSMIPMLDVKLPFVVQLFSRYIFDMRFLEMSCTIF